MGVPSSEFALRDERQILTRAEVTDRLNRVTNGLMALDLGPDRRIAVFAENAAETVLAYAAGLLAGCSVVPVGFHLTADEVAYILSDSDSRLVLAGPETVERAIGRGESGH
jgi:long-chain acyl-CoA synthetase